MRIDDRFRWLLWLSLSQIGMMLAVSNYNALIPVLQKEWSLTNGQAGWIYSAYQIGYVLFVATFTSLTDYTDSKYIYLMSALWAGITGISFSLWAIGFQSALILRTLMGIGLAGTYMPGLRMVSEKFPSHEKGKAVGIYVASFTLGLSVSLFLTGYLNSVFSWRWAFFLTSLGPIAGAGIAFFPLKKVSRGKALGEQKVAITEVLRNRPVLAMIGAYVCHMWEMFAMRGWIVPFLTANLLTSQFGFSKAVSLSAFIAGVATLGGAISNALGGIVSDRFGRVRTTIVIMLGSSLISLVFGWTRALPFWPVIALAILYGFMAPGESSVLSTGVTELAHPGVLGRTMALQSLLGWGAASLSPIVFGYILDLTNPADALARIGYIPNWGWAFMSLGIGALIGPLVLWRVRKTL